MIDIQLSATGASLKEYAVPVPSAKLIGAFSLFILLSACASLPGQKKAPPVGLEQIEAAQMRVASLEVEVSRLKSENARMASQLLSMQRERERLLADNAAQEDQLAAQEEAGAATAQAPAVPDPQPQANAVVDNAADPALARTDVPVETAPRLVQPTFASNETVFENEAEGEIETASVLFGVHLASYRRQDEAREGWQKLQRENPDELGLLEPRVETVAVEDKGVFLRLIGGGFSSEGKAEALCGSLKQKGLFCSVVSFEGQRLSLADAG